MNWARDGSLRSRKKGSKAYGDIAQKLSEELIPQRQEFLGVL